MLSPWHTACIVYKHEIVAFGQNQMKSHPFQAKFAKNSKAIFIHAEVEAIYNALKKLSLKELEKAELYVIRLKKDGQIGLSAPCTGCARCINTFKIGKVFHSSENCEEFV